MPPADLSATVTPTPRRVPEPYLRAEIAAFPLASEESFRRALLELDPQLPEPLYGEENPTRQLWRACENQFAQHTGWSLDRLVSARDLGWFGSRDQRVPMTMHDYLRNLARSHLVPRAGVTEIEESTDLSALDANDHYRWLTLTLPEDLLLAALGVEPTPMRVDVDPPLLVRQLLDLGVAEIHQHVGAGMNFPLLWVSALAALASPDVKEDALASPGAPLSEGNLMVRWLLAAAVARCVLAKHIIRGSRSLQDFLLKPDFLRTPAWTPRRRETLVNALEALATANDKRLPEIEPLRDLYADIHPTALTLRDYPLESVDDAFRRCDPIAVRLDLRGENVGERWFLRQSLAYLNPRNHADDKHFARIFWQIVRIRCLYYRTVVERPLTGGLQWFLRFFGRLGKLRKPLDSIMPEVSYHVAGEGHRIKALELRTTAADSAIGIGEYMLTIVKSWQRVLKQSCGSAFEPELGVIFHFVKWRDAKDTWPKGVPAAFWAGTHAEPYKAAKGGADVEHGRYVGYFAEQSRIAHALAEFITAVPSSLWLLRGLDIATDEIGIPTWVFAPLFRHVLDEAAKVSILKDAGPPLRITAHVGEDFRHLLEGMRRIYEQVHYILGNTPGRLGHAVALGVEPRTWAESVGSVLMPAEERLWDLVWEWRMYSKYRIKPEYGAAAPPGRMDMLLNHVRDLSERVFSQDYRVEELAEAHHMLHRFLVPPHVSKPIIDIGFKTFVNAARDIRTRNTPSAVRSPDKVANILEKYFDDESVFRRGQELIDVPIRSDEVAALFAMQYALRRGIAQNGIVVEVNPSSNLLIGDLLDLRNHPILRLFPPVPDLDGPPPVSIALGSDDPLTFSTQLLREYTLLHQAACAAGYPERVVQDWLESIRRTGMDARFTKAWRPCAEEKAKLLEDKLSEYLHLPRHDLVNKRVS